MNNIFTDLIDEAREREPSAEFFLATVASVDLAAGVTITPDGGTEATTKKYKVLVSEGNRLLEAGDRVVVMRHSGTCIVLGKIGTPGDPAEYVKKTGDTMSGNLVMNDRSVFAQSDALKDGTAASSSAAGRSRFYLTDKDGYNLGYLAPYFNSNGGQATLLVARRHIGDSDVANSLYLYVAPDGTRSVVVSDAAAWRAAIGAVNKAGDTMSGALSLEDGNFTAQGTAPVVASKNKRMDATASSIEANSYATTCHYDKDNRYIAYWQTAQYTTGEIRTTFCARKYVDGTAADNFLRLILSSAGVPSVALSHPAAWRSALGLGTSGSLPVTVGQGGTGAVGVSLDSTVSNIVTAASNFSFTAADYAQWGKLAMLHVAFTATAADTSTAWKNAGTLISTFRRPIANVVAQGLNSKTYALMTNGNIQVTGAMSVGSVHEITFTYLLS